MIGASFAVNECEIFPFATEAPIAGIRSVTVRMVGFDSVPQPPLSFEPQPEIPDTIRAGHLGKNRENQSNRGGPRWRMPSSLRL
jgi:hypothetical protein